MRVVLVSESTGAGGVETVMAQIAAHADPDRFRFAAFLPLSTGGPILATRLRALGVDVAEQPWSGRYDPSFVAALVRHLRRTRPDVAHVHLHHVYACEHLFAPLRIAGVPVLCSTDHIDPEVRARLEPVRALLKRANLRLCDRSFVVSRSLERLLLDRYRAPPDRVERVGNGVDLARFVGLPDRPAVRTALGTAARDFVVLAAARLVPQKGIGSLIDAASALRARVPSLRVWIAGDGPLRSELEGMARSAGVADRVRFLGHRDDVPSLLAAVDLYVLPSLFEGLPLGVLEAMAAGTPVLATAVSGTPDVVEDGGNGVLVPPGDATSLAAAIESLAASPDLRRALAASALETVRRDHDVRAVIARTTERYLEILNRKGANP